jgi:hypothetical protein
MSTFILAVSEVEKRWRSGGEAMVRDCNWAEGERIAIKQIQNWRVLKKSCSGLMDEVLLAT